MPSVQCVDRSTNTFTRFAAFGTYGGDRRGVVGRNAPIQRLEVVGAERDRTKLSVLPSDLWKHWWLVAGANVGAGGERPGAARCDGRRRRASSGRPRRR